MKNYIIFSFSSILCALILCSCHHAEGSDMYQIFPIQAELETDSQEINWAELTSEERKEYKTLSCVIDSPEDFPNENLMGLEKIKSMHIDFDKYTLLLCYNKIPGIVESHKYVWSKNLQEGVFELWMDFQITEPENYGPVWNRDQLDEDSSSEEVFFITYYCTALLVNKIPANSKVIFWW